jgi:hypothetical protein
MLLRPLPIPRAAIAITLLPHQLSASSHRIPSANPTSPPSGTGYIGSFTTLTLLENDYDVVIVDNLYNSSKVALDRIELISGRRPDFYQVDLTDEKAIDEVFAKHPAIDSVIHFAALKVGSILLHLTTA